MATSSPSRAAPFDGCYRGTNAAHTSRLHGDAVSGSCPEEAIETIARSGALVGHHLGFGSFTERAARAEVVDREGLFEHGHVAVERREAIDGGGRKGAVGVDVELDVGMGSCDIGDDCEIVVGCDLELEPPVARRHELVGPGGDGVGAAETDSRTGDDRCRIDFQQSEQ